MKKPKRHVVKLKGRYVRGFCLNGAEVQVTWTARQLFAFRYDRSAAIDTAKMLSDEANVVRLIRGKP